MIGRTAVRRSIDAVVAEGNVALVQNGLQCGSINPHTLNSLAYIVPRCAQNRRLHHTRLSASTARSYGIATHALVLHRKLTRLELAMALGGLVRGRGEDLLRVKGLVEFAGRPGRPRIADLRTTS